MKRRKREGVEGRREEKRVGRVNKTFVTPLTDVERTPPNSPVRLSKLEKKSGRRGGAGREPTKHDACAILRYWVQYNTTYYIQPWKITGQESGPTILVTALLCS